MYERRQKGKSDDEKNTWLENESEVRTALYCRYELILRLIWYKIIKEKYTTYGDNAAHFTVPV